MDSWLESSQKNTLRRLAEEVSLLAETILLSEDFSTDTPAMLAQVVKHTADLFVENLDKAPPTDYYEIHHFLTKVVSFLRYVERARVTQTPWSLIPAMEAFLQRQVGGKRHFIIRPTWSYNYGLIGDFWRFFRDSLKIWPWFPSDELKSLLQKEDKEENGLGDDEEIHCMSFPRVERTNCLLHANLGHEVGHILSREWLVIDFSGLWLQEEPSIRAEIRSHVEKDYAGERDVLFADWAIDEETAECTKIVRNIVEGGVAELLSDVIGMHLFGLSALAGAVEFAAMYPLDAPPLDSKNYPPWRYRLRKMIEYCSDDLQRNESLCYPPNHLGPLIEHLRNVQILVDDKRDEAELNSKIETRVAYAFIDKIWNDAKAKVVNKLPTASITAYEARKRSVIIGKLIERLEQGIPPNETGYGAADSILLQDIILSAWAFRHYISKANPEWGTKDDSTRLFRLVLKAVESWHFAEVWGPRVREAENGHSD